MFSVYMEIFYSFFLYKTDAGILFRYIVFGQGEKIKNVFEKF